MRRLVRRGQQDRTRSVLCDAVDDGRRGSRPGGPDQGDGVDVSERGVECVGGGEIALNAFDGRGQLGAAGLAEQRADLQVLGEQLADEGAAHGPGGGDDENRWLVCSEEP